MRRGRRETTTAQSQNIRRLHYILQYRRGPDEIRALISLTRAPHEPPCYESCLHCHRLTQHESNIRMTASAPLLFQDISRRQHATSLDITRHHTTSHISGDISGGRRETAALGDNMRQGGDNRRQNKTSGRTEAGHTEAGDSRREALRHRSTVLRPAQFRHRGAGQYNAALIMEMTCGPVTQRRGDSTLTLRPDSNQLRPAPASSDQLRSALICCICSDPAHGCDYGFEMA